ncbi:MAG: hypothetical protein ACYDBX_04555 [Patescibacteria group bacterium]
MKLADKRCYPLDGNSPRESAKGLTFRERLIIAVASNSEYQKFLTNDHGNIIGLDYEGTAKRIIHQSDEIIKQLESEVK